MPNPGMNHYGAFLCAVVMISLIVIPSAAAPVPDACNVPVIKNLIGPDVIYFDNEGQVGETFTFSADVTGGTPPYTYNWRFGGADQVTGTGQKYSSVPHIIADKWEVVSLRVTDSNGKSASWDPGYEYRGSNATLSFGLGWDEREGENSPAAPGNMVNVMGGPSSNTGAGPAYLRKVPTYPYKIPGCPSGATPSATGPSSTASEGPGIPWLPIVGGIAAVAIAAAAIAKGLRKKKPDDEKKKDEGPVGYILQISPTDTIKVSTKEGGSFTVTAWKVDENGSISHANNATITLLPQSNVPGLSVVPTSGMGSITVNVSLDRPAGISSAKIQIDAAAGGKGTSAFVTVNFEAGTNIEFD